MGGNGRRKRLLDVPDLVLCTAGLLACALASAETNDWLIVPGVRIGPLTGSSTRNSLQRMFAATKISDQPIDMDDGSSRPGTVVNADDPAAALAIIWSDETRMRPEQVFVCYGLIDTSCRWHTASAIGMNSRLSDLEKANGKPFVLLGFERDFAGTVISWEGGKLAREFEGAGRLVLRLRPGSFDMQQLTPAEEAAILADRVASDHPAIRKLNPSVYRMLFVFPR